MVTGEGFEVQVFEKEVANNLSSWRMSPATTGLASVDAG
jgi:hypothetical protein